MTPTTPRKPMTAPMTVATGPAGNNPPPTAAPTTAKKKKPILAIVSVLALVVIVTGVIVVWKIMHPGPPLPTAPTAKIVEWTTSEKMKTTEFGRQKELLGALDNREEEL